MKSLTKDQLDKVRKWIYRNARPVDLARYQYHFENGDRNNILRALASYQNHDGGFAYGIEPDFWNPNSSPTAVCIAFNILREVDYFNSCDPVIVASMDYLDSGKHFGENGWRGIIPSNNDYLHAGWWHYNEETWELCPTTALSGFIIRTADKGSSIYKKAMGLTEENLQALFTDQPDRASATSSYALLLSDLRKANLDTQFNLDKLEMCLHKPVSDEIVRDESEWFEYTQRPSNFITSPDSPFYQENADIMNRELDFIVDTINQDGVWDIYWRYSEDSGFIVCENWWKADIAIKRLLLLKGFCRLG